MNPNTCWLWGEKSWTKHAGIAAPQPALDPGRGIRLEKGVTVLSDGQADELITAVN